MKRDYMVLDVFTDRALAGNPLAVVLDGKELSTATMQAITREFNLSETVFVLPAEHPGHSAKVRIFTPAHELPFAGHPTIGTAIALAERRFDGVAERQDAVIVLEENIGAVRCAVELMPGKASRALFDLPKLPEAIPVEVPKDVVADAVGLEPNEIGFENHCVSAYSAGVPYVFIPVTDLEVMRRVKVNADKVLRALTSTGTSSLYFYTRDTQHVANDFHARMMSASMGVGEDPATGSAVAAFAGAIMRFDGATDGEHPMVIEQGYEMGRPSHIELELLVAGGKLSGARIAGSAVVVAEGSLRI